ncbi:MAG: hypothetical protein HC848_02420, partial [Limnobacter sp.]|nr:hypothetical protein [Limnobacter sp.]
MNQQCPEPTHSSNPQDPNFPDELTPIASYMVQQMRTNIMGDAVHAMQRLNTLSGRLHKGLMEWDLLERGLRWLGITQTSLKNETLVIGHTAFGLAHPKAIAWGIWTYMVAQNSSWDHKPVIGACFTPRSSTVQNYHAWGDRRYFYDIWSNIHYGYVGQTAGFMEWELLDGAGLEQIG